MPLGQTDPQPGHLLVGPPGTRIVDADIGIEKGHTPTSLSGGRLTKPASEIEEHGDRACRAFAQAQTS